MVTLFWLQFSFGYENYCWRCTASHTTCLLWALSQTVHTVLPWTCWMLNFRLGLFWSRMLRARVLFDYCTLTVVADCYSAPFGNGIPVWEESTSNTEYLSLCASHPKMLCTAPNMTSCHQTSWQRLINGELDRIVSVSRTAGIVQQINRIFHKATYCCSGSVWYLFNWNVKIPGHSRDLMCTTGKEESVFDHVKLALSNSCVISPQFSYSLYSFSLFLL